MDDRLLELEIINSALKQSVRRLMVIVVMGFANDGGSCLNTKQMLLNCWVVYKFLYILL